MISEVELYDRLNENLGIGSISDLRTSKRKIEYCYSRMIVSEYYKRNGMNYKDIAQLLNKDKTSIIYTLKKFNIEYEYNKEFRNLADKVLKDE